jgi:ClpP class serine protease
VAGGINEFADIIRNSPKPVTAYVGIMAASAHYWLASAASQVVIDATAQVGNIGIVTKRVMNKQTGVVEIVSSRAPDKRPDMSTPEGRAVIQAEVNAIEDVFISAVAQGRGLTPEDIAAYRGRMLTGVEAVAAGFADKLGSFESALAGLAGGTMGVQPMTATKDNTAAAQVPQITRAYLDENHQELVAAIRQEGTDAALADIDTKLGAARIDGATAERERILSVEAQLMPGHEALISALKADGHTTGPEAAVQVLAAEKKGNADRLTQHRADAPPPLSDAGSAGDDADSGEKRDFMSLVAAEVEAGKTRAQAIRTIAQLHPDLHTAWIHEQNQRKSA